MFFVFLTLLFIATLAHWLFILRPLILKKGNFKPNNFDIILKNSSHILLPIVSITGIFVLNDIVKILILLVPIVFIIFSLLIRKWIKKHYYILPLTNSICLTMVLILCL